MANINDLKQKIEELENRIEIIKEDMQNNFEDANYKLIADAIMLRKLQKQLKKLQTKLEKIEDKEIEK